jgi:hypothetical protein
MALEVDRHDTVLKLPPNESIQDSPGTTGSSGKYCLQSGLLQFVREVIDVEDLCPIS